MKGNSMRLVTCLALMCLGGLLLAFDPMRSEATDGTRITHRWGEHSTTSFTGVTQDALLINGGNEDSDYLGIRDSDDKHTLIYFNLSAIPAGTIIYAARLCLFWEVAYGDSAQNKSGYMMDLYRIADPGGKGMWIEDEATVSQRRAGVPWTVSGDVFTALSTTPVDRVFSHPRAYGMHAENFWFEWDVTSAVQGWVNGSFPNQGFLLDGRNTLGLNAIAHSSEHINTSTRPYLEITYAGTGTYPAQVSGLEAQYRDGQTFITWNEIAGSDPETIYRVYRHTDTITTANLSDAELLDEAQHNSAVFERLNENNQRLSTPFSAGPLPNGTGLYVYTVESPGTYYYAVTSVVRGNENRSIGLANSAGPVSETVSAVSPVVQYLENPDPLASGNRQVFVVWLGSFDPTGRYSDYGYANRRSVPYIFRVITPETWNPAATYPMLVFFHFFSDSYVGSGQNVVQPRFVLTADDYDAIITANLYGASMWYGYNSNYGTKHAPSEGVVVNYTERRVDWIIDWLMNRSGVFRVDPNRVYMKGGSMGGAAQWHYGVRRFDLFAAGENAVPGINLTFDPSQRHYPLWGYEPLIMTSDGISLNQRLDAGSYITAHPETDLPLMLTFTRKGDLDIPWPQMPPFFSVMDTSQHLGGMLYWTQGDHSSGENPADVFSEWSSTEEYEDWIYQFVRNQSYPAFSHFSLNDNPGNGDPTDGDPRGGFNRFVRWDTATITDTPALWEMTVSLHSSALGYMATADITPRRLQALVHTPGSSYTWENHQQPSNTIVQSGTVVADAAGLITLPNVILTKDGNRVALAVDSAPFIITYPQSQVIDSGQTATMSVVASGMAPLSYQWYQGSSGDTTNPISGATSSSYTTPPLTQTTSFWVRVTNAYDHVDSNTATVTVNAPPPVPLISLSTGTLSNSCQQGQNAPSQSFEVWNSGEGTLNYSISDDAVWLSCSPGSGSSAGSHNAITVDYSTSALSPGTYNATIEVSASGASNSPQVISVILTVNQVNSPPFASDQFVTINPNTPVDITLTATDPDPGDSWTYLIEMRPSHGTVTPPDGGSTVTYIPTPNYTGSDSFRFQAYDGKAYSNVATVSIIIGYSISGYVLDKYRQPIEAIQVCFKDKYSSEIMPCLETDEDGYYIQYGFEPYDKHRKNTVYVIPYDSDFKFSPKTKTVKIMNKDVTINFKATRIRP